MQFKHTSPHAPGGPVGSSYHALQFIAVPAERHPEAWLSCLQATVFVGDLSYADDFVSALCALDSIHDLGGHCIHQCGRIHCSQHLLG